MAATPSIKVYRDGEYVASFKHFEDAAIFVAAAGGVVKGSHSGKPLWTEGAEEFPASESYDRAAEVMRGRAVERMRANA